MIIFKRTKNLRLGLVLPVLLAFGLSACGGGGGGGDDDPVVVTSSPKTINGGGVKGPLANAVVTAFKFDPAQPDFKGVVVATGTTNSAAAITGLALPTPLNPPYILEFTSNPGTTDITTGVAPVIATMRTVITQSLLDSGGQIYATPLTTMAVDIAIANSNAATTAAQFEAALAAAADQVTSTVGFGMPGNIDIFATPPLIDANTDTVPEQADVAAYRSAVEALTAVVFAMEQQSSGDVETVLSELSLDLADGAIDGMVGGNPSTVFGSTTLDVLGQDPASLPIPNSPTNQTVADVQAILVAETATTGSTTPTTELDVGGSITTTTEPAETNPDIDNDGTPNSDDAFPQDPAEDTDSDGDGIGDVADPDDDNDGILDEDEGLPQTPTANDADGDGFDDGADNCPANFNPAQTNTDGLGDGGDACDLDDDEDTVADTADAFPLDASESSDADGDGTGDVADTDDDNDGIDDTTEDGSGASADHDSDGTPNREDTDSDNDGVLDNVDYAPYDDTVTFNSAPVTSDSSVNTTEDTAIAFVLDVSDDGVAPGVLVFNVSTASSGVLSGTEPNLTYTPNAEFNGNDSLTFTVTDGDGEVSNLSTVSFTVAAVNDPPVAVDDADSTDEDTPKTTINVLANDTDIEGDTLSVAAGNPVAGNGSVVNNNDGSFDYSPNADFNGVDSFDYVVIDGNGGSDTGTMVINVAAVNDDPVAVDDNEATPEDTAFTTANVLGNDSDPEADLLAVAPGDPAASNGTVVNNNDGTFDYTPNANFFGADSFSYTVLDGNGGADTGTVNVTISSVNDLPVGNADAFAAGVLNPTVLDVLANDSDVDGDTLTITGVSQGSLGSTVSTDGSTVTFTDVNNSAPNDETFTYDLFDGTATVSGILVTVSVSVNIPPVANPDAATTDEEIGVVTGNVLANDNDGGDGPSALSITASDTVSVNGGAVTNNGNGTFNYMPLLNFNGSDSFTYTVSDGASATVGTVTITVNSINDDPIAVDDNGSTDEDTLLTTNNVLTNDSDVDGDTLTVAAGNPGATNGSVVNNNDGTFDYTPNANFNGQDSFDYTVNDGNGGSAIATVTIDVAPINDPPVAFDDSVNTTEDTPVTTGNVLVNDIDIDGDTLSVAAGNPTAANGTVVNNDDGTFDYSPNANFNGQDSFDYTVLDGNGLSDIGTVTVNVGADNDAPTAVDDNAGSTNEDTPFTTLNVLVNDTDPEGDTLSVSAGNPVAANGSVVNNNNGTFDYTPNPDYFGADSFDYIVNDGNGGSDTGTVSVTVNPINDDPVATDDNAVTIEEILVTTVNVLLNDNDVDGDTLSVAPGNPVAANGTVVNNNNGTFDYLPGANFNGVDSFNYTVTDGNSGSDTGTVFITVSGDNDNPVGVDDDETTDEDTTLTTVNVLANDTDPDGDILFLSGVDSTSSQGFAVVNNNNGTFNYTPGPDFNGADSFNYGIDDGNGGVGSGTVNITVNPVNDAPTAVDDTETVAEDGILDTAQVTANDLDIDGDILSIFASDTSSANGGLVEDLGAGNFRYTPPADFNGVDSFNYTVTDGFETSTATVTITVTPTNDPPIAVDDFDNAIVDTVLTTINVLANDTDIDGDILSVTAGNPSASNGTVVNNNDGTFDYTPNPAFEGADSFDYTVSDGNGESDTGTVFIDVTVYSAAVISELLDPAIGGGVGSLGSEDYFGQIFPEFSYDKELYNPVSNRFSFDEKEYNYSTQSFVNVQNFGEDDQFLKADGSWVPFSDVNLEFSTVNHGDGSASLSVIDSNDSEELGRVRISALTNDISGELISDHLDSVWAAQMIDPSAVFGPGALQLIDYSFNPEIDFYEMETSINCDSTTRALLGGNCEAVLIGDFGTYAFTLDDIIQITPWVDPDDYTQTGLVRVHLGDNGTESLFAEVISSGNTVNYYVVDHFAANGTDAVVLALADVGAWVRDSTIKNTEMLRFTVPASFVGQFPDLVDIEERRTYFAVSDGAVRRIYPALVGDMELPNNDNYNNNAIDQILANFNPPPVPDLAPLVGTWVADLPSTNGDQTLLHFFANGRYEITGTCDLDGSTGLDYGELNDVWTGASQNHAWNSVSGKFSVSSFLSTRGLCGSDQRAFQGDTILVNGDTLTYHLEGVGDFTYTRMHRESNPLVGSWILGDIEAWGEGHAMVTFLDDTRFVMAQNCDSEGLAGFEYGTYTWDQGITENFSGTLSIDTNGGCGVHDNTGMVFSGAQIFYNGDNFTFSNSDGSFVFTRHSDSTLACDYESGWDDVAGEPLVFNSYNEFVEIVNNCGGAIAVAAVDLNGSSWVDTFDDNGDTIVETVTFNNDGTADIIETTNAVETDNFTADWTISNNYVVLSLSGQFQDVWAFTPSGIKAYTEESSWSSMPDLNTLDGSPEGEIWTGNFINSVNVAPIANADAATTDEDMSVTTGNLLANDTDFDSGPSALSITAFDAASANGGTVSDNGNGTFDYSPAANFNGSDSFGYTISDGTDTAVGQVTVTVNPVNDAPAIAQSGPLPVTMDEDNAPTAFVAPPITASDVDSAGLIWSGSPASKGTATVTGVGASPTVTYVADPDANGNDSFDVTVIDGDGGSATITINVDITASNDLPGITGSPQLTAVDGVPYSFTPTASDPDGQTFVFSIVGMPVWADFDTTSGRLYGTPALSDVGGDFSGIVISVTTGSDTADLPGFAISVSASTGIGAVWDQFDWDDGSTWQ